MLELKGKYNTAKVFTDNIDAETISQIINLCNQQSMEKSKIRIMPDCHAGAGCTIGTTMTIEDKIVPNLVGVESRDSTPCGLTLNHYPEKEKYTYVDIRIHPYERRSSPLRGAAYSDFHGTRQTTYPADRELNFFRLGPRGRCPAGRTLAGRHSL